MDRRTLAGAVVTAVAAVAAVVADFLAEADLLGLVLVAGLAGGVVVGALSRTPGHVGAGARAGAYGGGAAFVAFVAVGVAQSVAAGDLAVLVLGVQTLLIALLVIPVHALSGAVGAALGVRMRRVGRGPGVS
ncbi:hypothetical protein [Natronomonas marina]|jgi:hypothetical protein|uniref:hypothetical protein n=1 Tax=Natronomonas marina TaxID=2961939 RepID=UPI0020C9650A|nr:hypothetical protein [Natronomonas marina]